MDTNYFVPSIEDLHVGYECYILEEKLQKIIIEADMQFKSLQHQIECARIFTKYLTEEDLEAEGWKKAFIGYKGDINYENMYTIFENKAKNYMLGYSYSTRNIGILVQDPAKPAGLSDEYVEYHDTPKFTGKCRCINEFRQLIKLLGI